MAGSMKCIRMEGLFDANYGTEGNKTACRVVLLLLHCVQRGCRSLNSGADFGFDSKMTRSGKHVELLEMSLVNLKSSVRNDNTSYALAA